MLEGIRVLYLLLVLDVVLNLVEAAQIAPVKNTSGQSEYQIYDHIENDQ